MNYTLDLEVTKKRIPCEIDDSKMGTLEDRRPDGEANIELDIEADSARLKPRIGLCGGISFAAGMMIGSGIFVSPKGALYNAGSVGMSLIVWALCGVVSMILGLMYAELGSLLPYTGGEYIYINKVLGSMPAFLAVWVNNLLAYPASMAVLALVFADYLCSPIFGDCPPPESIRKVIAAAMIVTLLITNVASVRFAASSQMFFTVAKSAALVVISIAGVVYLANGRLENLRNAFEGSAADVSSYSLAIYQCMFAYGGYQNANVMAEELINPKRNIPRAVIISILFVTSVYLMTNLSYFVMLSKSEFLASTSVAYTWAHRAIEPAALLIPIGVCCSVYGAANVISFNNGRMMFAIARNGHFPEVMSYLHVRTFIPTLSVILTHVIALALLIPGDIGILINMSSFLGLFVNGMTALALLRLRRQISKRDHTGFRLPIVIPVLALLECVLLVVSPFIHPRMEFVYSAGFIVLGVFVYVPFAYFKIPVPGWDIITSYVQLLLQLRPTEKID